MGKRRVLFVDDEPNLLAGLRRSLHGQRGVWEMIFAAGGEEALDLLGQAPVDVIVSDMRMPGMDGGRLLAEVRRRHPETARIILSGHADRAMIVSAVGPTQQYLAKPCDAETLVATVERVLAIRDLVVDPRLRSILGAVENLPKPPAVYEEMIRLADDPEVQLADVVAVVEKDVGTSAELLRLVNSAFFGLPSHIPTVSRAVSMLGLETIQALALAGAVFRPGATVPAGLDLRQLSDRGLLVGSRAKRFAEVEGWAADLGADLFLAGIMHEVGLLVLATADPDAWAQVAAAAHRGLEERDDHERRVFGCTVTEASAYLLGLWGFRESVVHAVAGQPAPPQDPAATPDAQALSTARRLVLYGASDVHPRPGAFVDEQRWTRWQQVL